MSSAILEPVVIFKDLPATFSQAWFALAIVNRKHFLKIAEFAIRLPVVAQRRTAGSHGFLQYLLDGRDEEIDPRRFNLCRSPLR